MSMTLVHDESMGSAASEARLWDDGIEAMLERRDFCLAAAEASRRDGYVEGARGWQAEADDLSAQAGIERMRLLAFMLANRVTSGDLLAVEVAR